MSAIPIEWTVLERLLLAQAVHKYGEDDWTQVARILKQHPLLQGQTRLEPFNQKNCSLQYYLMLEDMDNESRRETQLPSAIGNQDIPKVVKLARHLYFQRVDELNKAIKQDEDRFMAVLSEIDQIKSGAMDQELTHLSGDKQDSPTLSNAGKADETVIEMAQHELDAQQSVDDKVMMADDNTRFDETTKESTPTPETQMTVEATAAIDIPQKQSEVNIDQTPGSPSHQITETTPTPSANMNDVDDISDTLQLVDPPSTDTTADDFLIPIPEDRNTDLMTSQPLVDLEEKNTDTNMDGNLNKIPFDDHKSAEVTTDGTFAIDGSQSMKLGPKRPSDGNGSSMDGDPLLESAPKRLRLDQLLTDYPPSSLVTTLDDQDTNSPMENTNTADNASNNEISQAIETKPSELERSYIPAAPTVLSHSTTDTYPQIPSTSILPPHSIPPTDAYPLQAPSMSKSPRYSIPTTDAYPLQPPSTSILPAPSIQSTPESTFEWTSKPIPELAPIEPSPLLGVDPPNHMPETSKMTIESMTPTQPTVFDQDDKSWTMYGDDVDGTESVTESDSNTATPTTTTTTTTTTPTSDKRRSGSSGINKDDPRQKLWQKHINLLWRDIANHKNGTMFMNPIKEIQAPLYYDVVKHPLDLKTIKNRIRDGTIRTTIEFERDVVLMLANSLMYNKEGTEIYQMALEMLQDVTEQIKIFKTAYGDSSAHTSSPSVLVNDQQKSLPE